MMLPELQAVAQIFTERLLNTAAEGVVLAGLVWVLLRLVGRQNSGTRFAIWFSTLLAIVALPFVSGWSVMASRVLHPASPQGQVILPASLAVYLFTAWAAGAGLLLIRLAVGLWRVHLFRRSCFDFDLAGVDPSVAGVLRDFESERRVRLCVSSDAAVPAAVGFFRPAIVFPAWLVPQLSADEIKTILLHELAHLRRWDDWTNLAQKIVKALFFFHPAVWWIENRLTLEREMACDDIVLAQATNPRAYASSLISFAEKLHGARGLALAQALVSRMHQMSLRVAQILDAKRPSRTGLWKPVLGLSAAMLALVLGAAPYTPQVVAFQAQPIQTPTQTAQRVQSAEYQPQDAATIRNTATEPAVLQQSVAPQARAISAAFHPRTTTAPLRLKVSSRRQPVVRTSLSQEQLPIQETIFILRTTQYDSFGSGIWTLCVWRVGGTNPAERQLDSAIVVSVI
ncbi:MAG TPA: M56 family metallopeptidase [Candidatus Sulfotelmatobacter sp.]|jgi:beta-lactamase regulating signal transducer with metallopeptidase domain|nr:M56 family metallopeptidase [Candidatus Sulfotelmatobacter sp.]